jgi:diketogulonate reductase-like aldo/keto reductase
MGTWNSPKDQVGESIIRALNLGYRHIDCAWIYKNEKEVGEALKKVFAEGHIKREDIFITSKVWNTHKSAKTVREACIFTMKSLGVEYLDLYLVHWPVAWKFVDFDGPQWGGEAGEDGLNGTRFDRAPLHQTWAEMEKLVDDGLVKSIGISNFNIQLMLDLLTYARIKPSCNQVELHPYHPQPDIINFCNYHHIKPVAYSPLGSAVEWQKGKPNVRDDPVIHSIAKERNETPSQTIIR